MYKLLIVEDEFIEREALAECVDWPSLGAELIGSAESAEEAVNLSLTGHFDILLTDIRLLGMSGLELARTLLARQPRLKVIINSGYSDFEYARQAVAMHACSFITKPIDLGELKDAVRKVVAELDDEREQARSSERLRQLVQENLPLIRRRFFERLVAGAIPDGELIKGMDYFGLDVVSGRFAVLLCELDGFERLAAGLDWEGVQMALESVREAVMGLGPAGLLDFYYIDRGRFLALLGIGSLEQKEESRFIFAAAERIRGLAESASAGSVTVAVGCAVGSIKDLRLSFKTAETALAMKFEAGPGQVISHADAALRAIEPGQIDLDAIESALALAVETANEAEAAACLSRLFNAISRRGWDGRRAAAACIRLLSKLLLLLRDLGENDERLFEGGALWGRLLECRSLPEMSALMNRCVSAAAAQIMERRASADRNIVRHIIDYIDKNLDSRITAAELADEFHYSPNYIGVVFKKDTGKTLTDHLKDVRLERARELLKNPACRIGEVAAKVGYPNVSYFCALFKKKYGVNPGEYKENA